jgi:hypothetical protein
MKWPYACCIGRTHTLGLGGSLHSLLWLSRPPQLWHLSYWHLCFCKTFPFGLPTPLKRITPPGLTLRDFRPSVDILTAPLPHFPEPFTVQLALHLNSSAGRGHGRMWTGHPLQVHIEWLTDVAQPHPTTLRPNTQLNRPLCFSF